MNMVWTTAKTSEPPPNLPTIERSGAGVVSIYGWTNFRGTKEKFGIKRSDRGRHLYIVGQTGTGAAPVAQLVRAGGS